MLVILFDFWFLPIVNYSEHICLGVCEYIAFAKISLTYRALYILTLKSELDGTIPTLAVDTHYLHVLLLIPYVGIVPVEPKHHAFAGPPVKLQLLYYVQILLLLLRHLRQVIPLVSPRLTLFGKKHALEAHPGLALIEPVHIHMLVLRRAIE